MTNTELDLSVDAAELRGNHPKFSDGTGLIRRIVHNKSLQSIKGLTHDIKFPNHFHPMKFLFSHHHPTQATINFASVGLLDY